MTLGKSLDFVPQFSPVINRSGSVCWDRTSDGAIKRELYIAPWQCSAARGRKWLGVCLSDTAWKLSLMSLGHVEGDLDD